MEEVVGWEDVMGQDDEDDDLLGAIRRKMARRGRGGAMVVRKPPLALPRAARLGPSAIRSAMGMGIATWAPADGADKVLTVEPQEPFRPERLIVERSESGGTFTGQILVRRIEIGTQPQSPSVAQPMPATMFRGDATGSDLDCQLAERGTQVSLTLGLTAAPAAGITVVAACGFYGQWVR